MTKSCSNLFFSFILSLFSVNFLNAQGIVNTEKMLSDAEEEITMSFDISGNFSFGNIRLFQSGSSLTTGLRKEEQLFRAVFGYDFLRSDGQVKSSDLFHQFRYNYFIGDHSFYGFYQIQIGRAHV